MKKILIVLLACMSNHNVLFSQTDCGIAVQQLSNYAAQVNQIYYQEYWKIIPEVRCPSIWNGQYIAPNLVQNCRLQMLTYLNQWYSQQCAYVNSCYSTIITSCGSTPSYTRPAPPVNEGADENQEIDTNEIQNLTAGVDEEKKVKIKIPKTVTAFKPN